MKFLIVLFALIAAAFAAPQFGKLSFEKMQNKKFKVQETFCGKFIKSSLKTNE